MKETLVVVSDMHINSVFGLAQPIVELDHGGEYRANNTQKWLWQAWNTQLDEIEQYIKKSHSTLILTGDIVDLDFFKRSWQHMSKNPAFVQGMAIDILEPLAKMFNDLFVIRGTEPHVGKDAYGEEGLARDLGAIRNPDTKAYSWRQLVAEFAGKKFDIAHHVTMGTLPWTYGYAAEKLAVKTMIDYAELGEEPPDVVIRGHQHRFTDSGYTHDTRGFTLPAWQWPAEYLNRYGKYNEKPHIGSLLFSLENNTYTVKVLLYKPARRSTWRRK